MDSHLLTQLIHPVLKVDNTDLRISVQIPRLVVEMLARGVDELCKHPIKEFNLYLEKDIANINSEILVIAYDKPHSVVALRLRGEPGKQATFLNHSHPEGEETLQLKGSTLDGNDEFGPGVAWSLAAGTQHHPVAVLDEDGEYLAVSYWPRNTEPVTEL